MDHSLLSPSGDTIPLLGYVLIGIGCFVVVSVVVILVATAALCRRRYIRKEMMNNFKVSGEEEGEVGGDEGGATSKEGWKWGVATGTFGLCAHCDPPDLMEGCALVCWMGCGVM